jgi:hypothetical protein
MSDAPLWRCPPLVKGDWRTGEPAMPIGAARASPVLAERFQYRRVLAQRSLGRPVQFCSVCWCVLHSAWERAAFIRGRNCSSRPESERNGFSVTFIDGEWCQTWWWMNGNYRWQSAIIDLNQPDRGPPEFVMLLRSRKVAFDPPEQCSRLASDSLIDSFFF